jgi:hypothetical protein
MLRYCGFCFCVLLTSIASGQQSQAYRIWSDSTNTFKVKASFVGVSTDQKNVLLQREDGSSISVAIARLCGDDQRFVSSKLNLTSASPFRTNEASPAAQSVPESKVDLSPQPDVSIVIVEGIGISSDEALRDAFRQAVRQVVGMLVDAQTQVANDKLIEDRILTYSNGYVKTYRMVGVTQSGGLYRCKISAMVIRKAVQEKLQIERIVEGKVDGNSLFAEALTKKQTQTDAKAIISSSFDDFPINLLKAEQVGEPTIDVLPDGKTAATAIVKVAIDRSAYESFSKRLIEILDKVALDKGQFVLKTKPSGKVGSAVLYSVDIERNRSDDFAARMPKSVLPGTKKFNPAVTVLAIVEGVSADFQSSKWRYFSLDRSIEPLLLSLATKKVRLYTEFKNDQGGLVDIKSHRVFAPGTDRRGAHYPEEIYGGLCANPIHLGGRNIRYDAIDTPVFFITPFIAGGDDQTYEYTTMLQYREVSVVDIEDLKNIAKIQYRFEMYGDAE